MHSPVIFRILCKSSGVLSGSEKRATRRKDFVFNRLVMYPQCSKDLLSIPPLPLPERIRSVKGSGDHTHGSYRESLSLGMPIGFTSRGIRYAFAQIVGEGGHY